MSQIDLVLSHSGVAAGKVSFQPRDVHSMAKRQIPVHFRFVGSNAETCSAAADAEWTTICEVLDAGDFRSHQEVRGCSAASTAAEGSVEAYRCLGLHILRVAGGPGMGAAVRNIRFWGRV